MRTGDWQPDQYSARYLRLFDENAQKERDSLAIEWLDPQPMDEILEIGASDGRLTTQLAPRVRRVIAADTSVPMIRRARLAARRLGIKNISFQIAGFMDFEITRGPVTKAVARDGFHHLPDSLKTVALERICKVLAPSGLLIMQDIVFPFPLSSLPERFPELAKAASADLGPDAASEIGLVAKREYPVSLQDLTDMLGQVGFDVEKVDTRSGCFATIRCRKR